MIEKIKYGSITLIIQDDVIIQVDKNEIISINFVLKIIFFRTIKTWRCYKTFTFDKV